MVKISVTRSGVVDINNGYEPHIRVNYDDMIDLIDKALEESPDKPARDFDGKFAATVTICIELLGDVEYGTKKGEDRNA